MDSAEFSDRTKKLGISIIKLTDSLPISRSAAIIADQILRCALSVGANYRAVCRAKSDKDFIHKMKIVEEEADETIYWLEILQEAELLMPEQVVKVRKEAKEILAMVVASINTKLKNLKS